MSETGDYVYVVMATAFEYNDEYSYASEGGDAVTAFRSKEAAAAEARERSIAMLRHEDEPFTLNGLYQYIDEDEVKDFIKEVFGEEYVEDSFDFNFPDDATDEQVGKVLDFLEDEGITLYYVCGVQVEAE